MDRLPDSSRRAPATEAGRAGEGRGPEAEPAAPTEGALSSGGRPGGAPHGAGGGGSESDARRTWSHGFGELDATRADLERMGTLPLGTVSEEGGAGGTGGNARHHLPWGVGRAEGDVAGAGSRTTMEGEFY